jgi:dTDP-glucose 4,6-dehydratase
VTTVVVTGGAGFIGSNLVRYLRRKHRDWRIFNIDKLTYAGNLNNLAGIEVGPDYSFIQGDVADRAMLTRVWARRKVKYVFHLAAETHVDRSLNDAVPFVRTNVEGTAVLLDIARAEGVEKFIYMSTDEVYGAVPGGSDEVFTEESPLKPRNPYSATKAAADLLSQVAYTSREMPVVILRAANNYGPYQHPEKFLPLMLTNLLEGRKVPIYGTGQQLRDWLFVEDTCKALVALAEQAESGSIYNLAGSGLIPNIELARKVLGVLKKEEEDSLKMVEDRPGHDFSYPLNAEKIERELNIKPQTKLDDGLRRTILWYRSNEDWWRSIREGKFKDYYKKQYSEL